MGSEKTKIKALNHPDLFGKLVGYDVLSVDRKNHTGKLRLKVQGKHLSPAKRVHGGVVSACFDVVIGLAVFSTMKPSDTASTVELKVNYLQPVHVGDDLMFKASVDFRGKRLCVAHAYVYKNGERTPTGMASGTYYVIQDVKLGSQKRQRRG